jgi:hypothetical protein
MALRRHSSKIVGFGLALCFALIGEPCRANAQAMLKTPGTPLSSGRFLFQSGSVNSQPGSHHLNAFGLRCLQMRAESRPQAVNPNIYNHVVIIQNQCLQLIKVRVCYSKTEHCTTTDVTGLKRKDVVLGIFPSLRYFQYTYEERFNH